MIKRAYGKKGYRTLQGQGSASDEVRLRKFTQAPYERFTGVILVDLGQQSLHITNQRLIFAKSPEARNRVNTMYTVSFFVGGAIGSTLGNGLAIFSMGRGFRFRA